MSSAVRPAVESIAVSPVIHFPREAETGETYLLTIDLAPRQSFGAWPYPADEEVVIYCLVNAEPLFSTEPLGAPAVVIHRFGGTYGPARFLITAAREPQEGVIQIKLVNGMGVPLTSFETPVINVRDKFGHKEVVDYLVRPRAVAATEEAPADVPSEETPSPRQSGKAVRVFVSSTYEDLHEYRGAVARSLEKLGHEAVLMERQGATPLAPIDKSYEDLAACGLYIGIFAWRYGYVPQENNPEQLSMTELEYRRAVALGLPRLIFLLDEDAARPTSKTDDVSDLERIRALRQELMSTNVVGFFSNVEQLAERVIVAVSGWGQQWRRRGRGGDLSSTPLSPAHISLGRLPITGSEFVGRESEVEWLDEVWDNTGIHIASVVGWGGIGKSALVNLWLAQMSGENYRGAQHVFAWSFHGQGAGNGRDSADQFIHDALQWFGDPDPTAGTPRDRGERLAHIVGNQCALLVLDGLDLLLYPPGADGGQIKDVALRAFLHQLVARNEGLCVITTRITIADLRNYSSAAALDLGPLPPRVGAELLRFRGVTGTQGELETAAQDFDGHPLSLTLLGTYLSDAFGGDIGRRGTIGALEEDELYGRHAYEMLSSYERWLGEGPELAVLRILSLSKGAIDRAAFDAVRAAPTIEGLTEKLEGLSEQSLRQVLSRLRNAGLLSTPTRPRSDMLNTHPLVREHFNRQLARLRPESWREGNNRLYEHYKRAAKEFPDTLEEMVPLYAAVSHGCAAGRHQEALAEVYHRRILRGDQLYNQERLRAYSQDLSVLSNFFDRPWSQVITGLGESSGRLVLTLAGHDLRALGRLTESTQPMQANLHMALSQERWVDAALVASNLSETYRLIGDLSSALKIARQGVDIASQIGDIFQRSAQMATLASALHQMGRFAEAEEAFREAETILRATSPQHSTLHSLQGFHFCELLLDQGKYQEVHTRAAKSIEWATQQDWLFGAALGQLVMGRVLLLQVLREHAGDFLQATEHLKRSVDGLRQAGMLEYLPSGLQARAELNRVKGDLNQAQADLVEAMSVATRGGMGLHRADCELGYARLYLAMGEVEQARASWERAREMVERMGYRRRDKDLEELSRLLGIDKSTSKHFYEFSSFRLYPDEGRLVHDGKRVSLTSKEFSLLYLLVRNSGMLLTRAEIINAIWQGARVNNSSIHRLVSNLRKVLGGISKEPHLIQTVQRGGYRFIAAVQEHGAPGGQAASDTKDLNSRAEIRNDPAIDKDIFDRLHSAEPSERAAAIVELSRVDTDEAFQQICAGFDDASKEVRGAAARALYDLRPDRAESFTRALREASPERRRQIGASISSSGLAVESISQLTGESREKTYEAFSLLFLMAKAGEVQPLVRAIEGHPSNEVRLAVVKLLALSGQKEILPAFRRLAVRGSLPTEVRSAVMEAIYQISSSQPSAETVPETDATSKVEDKGLPQAQPIVDRSPYSLVLLVDRDSQESTLSFTYRRHAASMPRRPFICIIHGRESEVPELYVERLTRHSLPSLLSTESPLRRIPLTLSLERNAAHTSALMLGELTLAFQQGEPTSALSLADTMGSSGEPILLDWNMDTMSSKAEKERRLSDFLKFWDEWSDFPSAVVIICLSLRYPDPKTSIYKRTAIKRSEEETRSIIKQLNFGNYKNIGGVVLPELLPIRKADVLEFIHKYIDADEDRRRINLELSTLFKSSSPTPMGQLAPRLQHILEGIIATHS